MPPSCLRKGCLVLIEISELELYRTAGDNYKLVLDLEAYLSTSWLNPVAMDWAHPGEATSEELASRTNFPWETLQAA